MNLNILGFKVRLEIVILLVVLGMIMGSMMLCSCSKISSIQEGMAVLDYKMGDGVNTSWENEDHVDTQEKNRDAYNSNIVMPEEQLHFFSNTEFKPECCGSNYASSGGCACMNKQQMQYINTRGGNRTHNGI
jgi:hypothetical protein